MPQVDYVKQAHFPAKRIKKYLNIGTTVVTDSKDYLITNYPDWGSVWDRVIEIPFSQSATTKRYYDGSGVFKTLEFKNDWRTKAYELTPYDETILLDSDYIISNDILKHCFAKEDNFLIYKNAKDLSRI